MIWAYVHLGNLLAFRNQFAEAQQAYDKACETAKGQSAGLLAEEFQERPAIEKIYRKALAHWRKTSPEEMYNAQNP